MRYRNYSHTDLLTGAPPGAGRKKLPSLCLRLLCLVMLLLLLLMMIWLMIGLFYCGSSMNPAFTKSSHCQMVFNLPQLLQSYTFQFVAMVVTVSLVGGVCGVGRRSATMFLVMFPYISLLMYAYTDGVII